MPRLHALAFCALALSSCAEFNGDSWIMGPSFSQNRNSVQLAVLIDGAQAKNDDASYWKLEYPREELPDSFSQAFICELEGQSSSSRVLALLDLGPKRYLILENGLIAGAFGDGPSLTYAYTDPDAFQSVKTHLVRKLPASYADELALWKMGKCVCKE